MRVTHPIMRAPPSGPAGSASCSQPASLGGLKSPPPSSEGPRWGSSPSPSPAWRLPLAWEGKRQNNQMLAVLWKRRVWDMMFRLFDGWIFTTSTRLKGTNKQKQPNKCQNDEQHSQCFPLCYFSPWEDINSSLGEQQRENSVCYTAIHFSLVSIPFKVYIRTTF